MATNEKTSKKKKQTPRVSLLERLREWDPVSAVKDERTHFICGLVLLGLMIYICIMLVSFFFTGVADQSIVEHLKFSEVSRVESCHNWAGKWGAWLSNIIMNKWFGIPSLMLAFYGLLMSLTLMRVRTDVQLLKAFVHSAFLMVWLSVFLGFCFVNPDRNIFLGGAHGYFISEWLKDQIGPVSTFLVLLITMLIYLVFVFQNAMPLMRRVMNPSTWKNRVKSRIEEMEAAINDKREDEESGDESEEDEEETDDGRGENNVDMTVVVGSDDDELQPGTEPTDPETGKDALAGGDIPSGGDAATGTDTTAGGDGLAGNDPLAGKKDEDYDALAELGEYDPKKDLNNYKNPSLNLLNEYEGNNPTINQEEQQENKRKIVEVLESFGISISSIKATVGPTVTLYEIVPKAGIRISKVKSLENDIALSLAALGIRIIAPIPGKGTIGIEVPNRKPQTVSMRRLMASKKFQETKYDLPVVLGKTIMNEVFMFDLCKMPHLLVAGATGQGKSVGLNDLITSLLYKKHPSELKLVMVDPKMVEFSIYSAIDHHYLAKLPGEDNPAIITDPDKVVKTLKSLTVEMDDRYDLLSKARCRNVKEYNEKFRLRKLNPKKGHRYMPYIVIIIDEFGDLIMTAGKEIELPIARIAQKARAVGMHMVIATQRPTTNIITGTIKANFPARLAFRVTSMIDSRTILDASGAQQLIGKGDALFSQGSELTRIQCAFVDTPEVENVVDDISAQPGFAEPFELPEVFEEGSDGPSDLNIGERDPLFDDAARLVVSHQQGSTSLIQRRFSIGYNRAGRIVDQLEKAGIIGPSEGSKARQVLVSDLMDLEQRLANM